MIMIMLDAIKIKIQGRAREAMQIKTYANTWKQIKPILLNNRGEKQPVTELFEELKGVSFRTNCLGFDNEIKEKLRALITKTMIILGEVKATSNSIISHQRKTLHIFRSKFSEPMQMLETAMDILFEG